MRICCYTDTFFPWVGGAETVLDNLATELTHLGHEIVVLAPKTKEPDDRTYCYPVVRYRRPFSKRFSVRLILPRLIALHRKHRFDVLHCHSSYPPAYVGLTFRRLFGTPVVARPHGSDVLPGGRIRKNARVTRRLESTLRRVDAVIAQGSFLKDTVTGLGVEESRVHVINNGVRLEEFATGEGFDHSRPYILGLGNLISRKGFDVLLRAYAMLDKDAPDLLIAGRGNQESTLRALATELNINDRVRFVGFVEGQEKVNLYRAAEFFVCPSRMEPFGNVILEAFASGLPVVATAVGGNIELIGDDERGVLCPPEDPTALAAALTGMVRRHDGDKAMNVDIRSYIERRNWSLVAAEYLRLYDDMLGKTGGSQAVPAQE